MKSLCCFILDPLSAPGQTLLKNESSWLNTRSGSLEEAFENADALIVRTQPSLPHEVLKQFKKLQVIVRAGNGLDHIDLKAAESLKITVLSTPEASADSAAELSVLMILLAARQIQHHQTQLKNGEWRNKVLLGFELHGKTAGIIGLGRIGGRVAMILQSMGMNCLTSDPYIPESKAKAHNVQLVSLNELLASADLVSIHTPLTEETKRMIDQKAIEQMKNGSILVNCARGGIVDEMAACHALKIGKLFSYAADVFETEPLSSSHPLLQQSNFIGTAHLGARTVEAQKRVDEMAAKTVVDFFKKEKLN